MRALAAVVTLLLLGSLGVVGPTATAAEPSRFVRMTEAAADVQPRAVTVKRGKYEGRLHTEPDGGGDKLESFALRVTKKRKVADWTLALDVICSYYPPEVETHPFAFPKTKINRKGKVNRTWTPNDDTEITLKLTFKGGRIIRGKIDYTVGVCVRVAYVKGKHV